MTAQSPIGAVARVLAWRPAIVAVHLVSMALLSRLIGPDAFGAFAVVVAVATLADVAIDFGVSSNLTRGTERDLPHETLRAAIGLWIAAAAAGTALLGLTAAFGMATGTLAAVAPSLAILACVLPLLPAKLAAEVVLRRRLDMRLLSWLPAAAALVGLSVAALSALMGLGAVALAIGLAAERAATAIALLVAQGRLFPARPSLSGWGAHLSFGSAYTATVVLPKVAMIVRLSIIGAQLGTTALGFMNRAKAVADLNDRAVLQSLLPLGLPLMANAAREGASAAQVYRAKVDYLIVLCWPAAAVVALLAEPLVLVLLGARWEGAVPLVRILSLAGLTYPVTKLGVKYFALIGAERVMLAIQLRQQALSLVFVAVASFASIAWVCAALVAAQSIKALRVGNAVHRLGGPSHMQMWPVVSRGAAVTLAAAIAPVAVLTALPEGPAILVAGLGLAGAAAGWAGALALGRHPLAGHARRLVQRPG